MLTTHMCYLGVPMLTTHMCCLGVPGCVPGCLHPRARLAAWMHASYARQCQHTTGTPPHTPIILLPLLSELTHACQPAVLLHLPPCIVPQSRIEGNPTNRTQFRVTVASADPLLSAQLKDLLVQQVQSMAA